MQLAGAMWRNHRKYHMSFDIVSIRGIKLILHVCSPRCFCLVLECLAGGISHLIFLGLELDELLMKVTLDCPPERSKTSLEKASTHGRKFRDMGFSLTLSPPNSFSQGLDILIGTVV